VFSGPFASKIASGATRWTGFFKLSRFTLGVTPRLLRNENGLAPHQTDDGREALRRHSDIDIHALLDVFDRAFDPMVHARWNTASSLANALKQIRIGAQLMTESRTPEEILTLIKRQMEGHEEERIRHRSELLEKARSIIRDARDELVIELTGFGSMDGNNEFNTREGRLTGRIGLVKLHDHSVEYTPNYLIELNGEEIVITFADNIVFRGTEANFEAETPNIISTIRTALLAGLQATMNLD
jgi:hypothetical protein